MRLNGKRINNDNTQIVVIPRKETDLVFKFKPVINEDDFEKLGTPLPSPPTISYPDGSKKLDYEDEGFRTKVLAHIRLKNAWMFLTSIAATESLEWETINLSDPATWLNYEKELKDAEFTDQEIKMLAAGFNKANAFDEEQLEAARDRFLASTTQ